MEAARHLELQDKVVCTYQLTRSVKLQLVKTPNVRSKTTTAITLSTQVAIAVVLAFALYALVSTIIPQHTLRFMAMTCSMAGWAYIGLSVVSRERHTVLIYLLSAIMIFSTGIAGMNISVSYLLAGLLMNTFLPFLPMLVNRSSIPLRAELLAGWSVFYLAMTVLLATTVLA